jgi:hypothetical protein
MSEPTAATMAGMPFPRSESAGGDRNFFGIHAKISCETLSERGAARDPANNPMDQKFFHSKQTHSTDHFCSILTGFGALGTDGSAIWGRNALARKRRVRAITAQAAARGRSTA